MMAAVEEDWSHLQARFFTKQKEYSMENTPFSLPGNTGCAELSSLVNKVLQKDEEEELQFDFLINGEYLRSNIKNYLDSKGISTEVVLEIEYVLKQEAPQLEQTLLHEDWVSGIDVLGNYVLSGSYDNLVRVWDTNGHCVAVLEGHSGAVKDVAFVAKGDGTYSFLSASHDQNILLWEWSEGSKKGICHHLCKGHAASVDALAVHPGREKFGSASWDKMIKIWSTAIDLDEKDADEENKERSKKRPREELSERKAVTRTPLQTLSGHREAVSSLQWLDSDELCSGSWDHTIKIWDVDTGNIKNNLVGNKVINSVSYSAKSKLVASGSTDRFVRLWDPRSQDGVVIKSSILCHDGWVSTVQWSPDNDYELVSGSYDTSLKIWDIRSPEEPLFSISAHQDKVMCSSWKETEVILSGGADAALHIHRYSRRP